MRSLPRLGGEYEIPLADHPRVGAAGEPSEVVLDRELLSPPREVERHATEDSVYQSPVRRGQAGQHLGRLVRAERMQLHRQVEPAVEGRAVFLDRLHRTDGRTAQDDVESGLPVRVVEEGTEHAFQLRRLPDHLRKLVEHQQQRFVPRLPAEVVKCLVPVPEGTCAKVPRRRADGIRSTVGELLQFATGCAVPSSVEDHPFVRRELLKEGRLTHASPAPDEGGPRVRLLPPFLQCFQLLVSADENHGDNVTDINVGDIDVADLDVADVDVGDVRIG